MSTTEQKTERTPAVKRSELIQRLTDGMRDQYAALLPEGLKVDRFTSGLKTTLGLRPELLECTADSLVGAMRMAAQDGLIPDGKEALISARRVNVAPKNAPKVYQNQASYMPMVRGIIKVMYATGIVLSIDAAAVYEKDDFDFERGDHPRITHKPYMGAEDPGKVRAAYVVFKLSSGEVKREVMTRRDLEHVRASSNSTIWESWYDQLAIKSVIKRASKQLPSGFERLDRLIDNDNQAMGFDFDSKPEAAPAEKIDRTPGQPSRLHNLIGLQPSEETTGIAEPAPEPSAAASPEPDAVEEEIPGLELDDFDDLQPPAHHLEG